MASRKLTSPLCAGAAPTILCATGGFTRLVPRRLLPSSCLPSATHAIGLRHFRSGTPIGFKYKIKIKDPDQNQVTTPLDYDNVHVPGFSTPERSKDEDGALAPANRARDAVYQKNLQRKMAFTVDPNTRARTMKSWPMVSMGLNALKDTDIPQGIRFNVVYHDTHAYERHTGPTVLILHGLQLPAANFSPLIEPLLERNCRVIAPLFPLIGHNVFKPTVNLVTTSKDMALFSHSTIERGIFVGDFLSALLPQHGRQVDVVVAADIGAYPALWLAAHAGLAKSLVCLDAFPAIPPAATRPQTLHSLMCKLYETRMHFIFAVPYMYHVMRALGATSMKEASAFARAIAFADYRLLDGGLTTLEMKGLPAVVYAGKRNKFVKKNDAEEMIRRLGIEDRFVEDLEEAVLKFKENASASPASVSPASASPTSAADLSLSDPIFQRTLTHSCARFFEPREQDDFGRYNRRYAKADWFHLTRHIAKDIVQLTKRVQGGVS